jgi:hypothetical protein
MTFVDLFFDFPAAVAPTVAKDYQLCIEQPNTAFLAQRCF